MRVEAFAKHGCEKDKVSPVSPRTIVRTLASMWSQVGSGITSSVQTDPYLEIKCQPFILVAGTKSESNRKQREIMLRRSFMSVTCTDSHKDKIQRSQSRLRGASCG